LEYNFFASELSSRSINLSENIFTRSNSVSL
jgi:hypothetical protein